MTSRLTRSAALCVAVLLATCSSGCILTEFCRLFNDSGSDVTIVRYRTGDARRQTMHLKVLESIVLPDWESWELRIVRSGEVLRYVPRMPAARFALDQWLGVLPGRVFTLQIDPRGRIYALTPDQSTPATTFVSQPKGFPLTPIAPKQARAQ
jgi:hypothetical protein